MSSDGSKSPPGLDFEISPQVKDDIRKLHDRAVRNPDDPHAANLVRVSINALQELQNGHPGTKPLEPMSSYPDLSDCRTLYVGANQDQKPSHRIVFRDVAADHPGGRPRREVLAVGEREAGRVYQTAGARLGRPVGLTLEQLHALPEPTADRGLSAPTRPALPATPAPDHDHDEPTL